MVDALFGPGMIGGEAGRRTEDTTSKLGVGVLTVWCGRTLVAVCSCEKKLLFMVSRD